MTAKIKTAKDILLKAADTLENNQRVRWGRGVFIQPLSRIDHTCMMCAHGVIDFCAATEKQHKELLFDGKDSDIKIRTDILHTAQDIEKAATREGISVRDYLCKKSGGEADLAHYYAVKSGLTVRFNDMKKRTKKEIIDKLRQAAELAGKDNK